MSAIATSCAGSASPSVRRELEGLLRLRGGRAACEQALELSANETARSAIGHLCGVWDALEAYGVSEHVLIDLTMIGDFSYYTGMTFEGYASDLGFPVVAGGRYDNLLQQFGRPAPATGFAIKTTRVLELVGEESEPQRRILIGYDAASRERALAEAGRLRGEGAVVVTALLEAPGVAHGAQARAAGAAAGERLERKARRLPDGESVRYGGQTYGVFVPFSTMKRQERGGTMSGEPTKDILKVAMPKGRIYKQASRLFREAGLLIQEDLEDTRKLIIEVPDARMEFIMAKPVDVPTYVEYGVADIGVVGKDVLMEENKDVYELLDLGIAPCRMSVIGLPDWKPVMNPRVATKYPNVASQYFRERGQQVEVIKLNGSIELAPLIGLADRIVDMVETGQTLRDNGLVEMEPMFGVTSRLIANRVSYRMKNDRIQSLCDRLQATLSARV